MCKSANTQHSIIGLMAVYFDNSATTQVDPDVLEAMLPYFTEKYGNASSLHSFGSEAFTAIVKARKQVADLLNAVPREVIFTSGGTESDNLAIQGAAFYRKNERNGIITSVVEHPAVLNTCRFLEQCGFKVTYLPVDEEGFVSEEDLKEAVDGNTSLVTIMAASNEIGTIQPVEALAEIAKDAGALFHTDAVQAAGKVPMDFEDSSVDMISISGHKIHAPKGVGALLVKEGVNIRPLMYGGGHEWGMRPSTENVPGIVGLGKASEICMSKMDEDIQQMTDIRDFIIDTTLDSIEGVYLNGPRENRLCNNANFRFDYIDGESLILYLDMEGIAASTGSACSTGSTEPSHVLRALGLAPIQCRGSLRLSLSRFNVMSEAEYFASVIPSVVEKVRAMSPLGDKKNAIRS